MGNLTINQLIYNLRLLLKDNKSDDLKFTDRNLEFIINYLRVKLIRQDNQKGRSISNNIEQQLGPLELEIIDSSESNDFITGVNILRTVKELPSTIDIDGNNLITYVGGLGFDNKIDYTTYSQAVKKSWSKYASKRISAFLYNNRLYISGCNNYELQYITVNGVFENPRELFNFNREDGSPCYDPNKDKYPLSQHMIDMINSIVKRQELDLYYQLIEDKVNDGQSNS